MYDFQCFIVDGYRFSRIVTRQGVGTFYHLDQESGPPLLGRLFPIIPKGFEDRILAVLTRTPACRNIRHPNVLPLHMVGPVILGGERSQRPCLVTDYYDESSQLVRYLTGEPMPAETVVPAALTALDGLTALRRQNLCHGNLGPETLIVRGARGLALLNPLEAQLVLEYRAAFTSGTSDWDFTFVAPESLRQGYTPDVSADGFVLGTLMYTMLTGTKPFNANTLFALDDDLLATARAPDPRRSGRVDEGLALVLAMALSMDRQQRYARPEDMANDLEAVRIGQLPPLAVKTWGGQLAWQGETPLLTAGALPRAITDQARPGTRRIDPPRRNQNAPARPPEPPRRRRGSNPRVDVPDDAANQPGNRGSRILIIIAAMLILGLAIVLVAIARSHRGGGPPANRPPASAR